MTIRTESATASIETWYMLRGPSTFRLFSSMCSYTSRTGTNVSTSKEGRLLSGHALVAEEASLSSIQYSLRQTVHSRMKTSLQVMH